MTPPSAPAVDLSDGVTAVPVDVEDTDATLRFDVARRSAEGRARVAFVAPNPGHPTLDLRQEPSAVRLDGRALGADALPRRDLGGGPGAGMRVLAEAVNPGRHVLEVDYAIGTPDTEGALPLEWVDGGIRFDLWMSDLYPGRYLEMWVPANLCHDRFGFRLRLEILGTDRPHRVITNGSCASLAEGFELRFPPHFTALSPMVVLGPADELVARSAPLALPGRSVPVAVEVARYIEVDADLEAAEADVRAWLVGLAARYGPWAHGDAFRAVVWGPGRGMEYDGATTAALGALEHEVFHSWFGRGVKPATAADGWIDEAFTSWATASRRREGPRFSEERLELDAPPVELYPPHPWSRYTPVASYSEGAAFFGALAALMGGAGRLRSAMASWYTAHAGQLVTTAGLEASLARWSGVDLAPWFERFVYGRGDA